MDKFKNDQIGIAHLELDAGWTYRKCMEQTKGFTSRLPLPSILEMGSNLIIDDSILPGGTKTRFGEYYLSTIREGTLVYVAPRVGFASIALANLCRQFNKKLVLFMPACKEASDHQLRAIELGAKPMWRRVAAMPNANKYAREWAEERGHRFVPFGLKDPLVVAGGVRAVTTIVEKIYELYPEPKTVWSVISTGVLTRTLQIAIPNADFRAVAVARNIKQGELGRAVFDSYHRDFGQKAERIYPWIDSCDTYDHKAVDYFMRAQPMNSWLWSVAGNVKPNSLKPSDIDSQREWGEIRD